MVTEKEIARINELAKKQKEGTLTAEEGRTASSAPEISSFNHKYEVLMIR